NIIRIISFCRDSKIFIKNKRLSRDEEFLGLLIIFLFLRILLRFFEPLQKWFGGLADLLGRREVDVLLAGTAAPLLDGLLFEDVGVVELVEDLRNAGDELGVLLPDEAL